MKVVAYTAAVWANATRKAAGVEPFLSPPLTAETAPLAALENADFIFFALHGGRYAWYGQDDGIEPIVALTDTQVASVNLKQPVIFAVNCEAETGNWINALLRAGARCVVGGRGANYAVSTSWLAGAHLLGWAFLRALKLGATAGMALNLAKAATLIDWSQAGRDSRQFALYGNAQAKLGGQT